MESKHKFNGIEFNHHEFEDGSGLDLYTARFRGYDPQLGHWNQTDPRPNTSFSPYAAMELNPILNRDILGDTTLPVFTVYCSIHESAPKSQKLPLSLKDTKKV